MTFGGTAATNVIVVGPTSITATTPAHAVGAVDVVVTTPGGTGTGSGVYTYVIAPLSIGPAALVGATAARATNQTITVSGGTKPYTTLSVSGFSAGTTGLTAANLTTNAAAGTVVLNGTPTAAGTASFTVNVTDTPGDSLAKTYTLTVNPALSIAPATLAGATAGTATNQTITVSNGTKPYTTFNVSGFIGGTTGLTAANLTTNAGAGTVVLSGTPTAPGTASFTVNVTDTAGATLTKSYTLTVGKTATAVTLSTPTNRIRPGQLLELRIVVSNVAAPAIAVPTGSVAIKEGTTALGVLSLTDGQVVFKTDTLNIGKHPISVVYQESPTHASSGSSMDITVDARVGPEFRANTVVASSQHLPSIARLADNGFVIVWQSYLEDGSGWGIFGQRYNAAGTRAGAEFLINTTRANSQTQPSVAGFSLGGFVVSWSSVNPVGTGPSVRAQRFSPSGAKLGGEFIVSPAALGESSVVTLEKDAFVIVWVSGSQFGGSAAVRGRVYNAAGTPTSAVFLIGVTASGSPKNQSVAALAGGGFVTTWTEGESVYTQRVSSAGNKLGTVLREVSTATRVYLYPIVSALKDGGFVLVFESAHRNGSGVGLFGRRYRVDGTPAGALFTVNRYGDPGAISASGH